jgi:pimeloyl-ACP methyl ester carboxylesterase
MPGLHGTSALFGPFARALAPHFDVRTLDHPCDARCGYDELTELAAQALPSDAPFVLFGESFSGPIAIRLAARAPRGIVGLVLTASFATCPWPWLAQLAPLARVRPPTFAARFGLIGSYGAPDVRAALDLELARLPLDVFRARITAIRDIDVRADLERIAVPVLDVRGTRDLVVPRRAGRVIRAHAPAARTLELDAPHLVAQARPLELARTLADAFGGRT